MLLLKAAYIFKPRVGSEGTHDIFAPFAQRKREPVDEPLVVGGSMPAINKLGKQWHIRQLSRLSIGKK